MLQHLRPEIDIETDRFFRCRADVAWHNSFGKLFGGEVPLGTTSFRQHSLAACNCLKYVCRETFVFFDQPMISVRAPYNTIITCMCGQSLPFGLHVYIYIIIYIYL